MVAVTPWESGHLTGDMMRNQSAVGEDGVRRRFERREQGPLKIQREGAAQEVRIVGVEGPRGSSGLARFAGNRSEISASHGRCRRGRWARSSGVTERLSFSTLRRTLHDARAREM